MLHPCVKTTARFPGPSTTLRSNTPAMGAWCVRGIGDVLIKKLLFFSKNFPKKFNLIDMKSTEEKQKSVAIGTSDERLPESKCVLSDLDILREMERGNIII